MSAKVVRVGVVDSGCPATEPVAGGAAFVIADGALWQMEPEPDQLGHGSSVIEVIRHLAPGAELYSAQVFQSRFTTTAAQVAAAIDWLLEQQVDVINLSLGLRQDREVLRTACERALRQGVLLCASSPARGEAVYPADYPGVFRMTGDARCARDEIAHLETAFADFGGCVRPMNGQQSQSGASLGCAHMSAHLARYLAQTLVQDERPRLSGARDWLIEQSCYQGPERRTS